MARSELGGASYGAGALPTIPRFVAIARPPLPFFLSLHASVLCYSVAAGNT
jgi:hypothetical protein